MDIIVQFAPEIARALQQTASTVCGGEGEILNSIREAGASIEPLHAGSNDPQLNRYFVIHVRDARKAEELATRLRSFGPTEAAYIKPHEEAP